MTKKLDLWLHLVINLLSTLLLGASNYTMQCLSAPTRNDINKAHQQRVSVDIGIPSVRNLRRISWRRVVLWWLLGLSSIPLHFMYNSAVFSTLSTHPYSAAVVSHDFLTGAPFNQSFFSATRPYLGFSVIDYLSEGEVQHLKELRVNQSTLTNLSSDACLRVYRKEILPDRLDVLAVSSATDASSSLLSYWSENVLSLQSEEWLPYAWTCTQSVGDGCDFPPQNWTIDGYPIDYCLSQPTEPRCKLQLSLVIMIIVILCNLAKILCMSLTIWKPASMPLLTLGDVIASFLDQPDPNTANNCLASKYRFRQARRIKFTWGVPNPAHREVSGRTNDGLIDRNEPQQVGWSEAIRTCKPVCYRWYHATSLKRWIFCISL